MRYTDFFGCPLESSRTISSSNKMKGTYLVCFRNPETDSRGHALFGNDFLEACVTPCGNRLFIKWTNGFTAKVDHKMCFFKELIQPNTHTNMKKYVIKDESNKIVSTVISFDDKKLTLEEVKDKSVDLSAVTVVNSDTISNFLCVRSAGKLRHKAFYLSNFYDWKLEKDDRDLLCLVPTKKD